MIYSLRCWYSIIQSFINSVHVLMPITYDIKTDFLYKKGKAEGKAEGIEEGMERKSRIVVARGYEKGLSLEEIAELADMPVEWVIAVIREIETEK